MSVILNALRSHSESPSKNGENTQSPPEGITWADKGAARHLAPPARRTILALAGILVGLSLVVGVLWLYQSQGPSNPPPPLVSTLLPATVPANVPLGVNPEKLSNLTGKAKKKFQEGAYEDSLAAFREAVSLDSKRVTLRNGLGLTYLKLKKWNEAEIEFKTAFALDPTCAECLNNLGYLKTLQDQADAAEDYLNQAIDLDSDYADPYFNLGVLYEANGDTGSAIGAFEEYSRHIDNKKSDVYLKVQKHLRALKVR